MKTSSLTLVCFSGIALATAHVGGMEPPPAPLRPYEPSPEKTEFLRRVPSSKDPLRSVASRTERFVAKFISPDERLIASISDKKLAERSYVRRTCIHYLPTGKRVSDPLPTSSIDSLAFAPDGKALFTTASGSGPNAGLVAWDFTSGKRLRAWRVNPPEQGQSGGQVALSPDGKVVAYSNRGQIRFYDRASGEELRQRRIDGGEAKPISSFCFSPDGQRVLGFFSDYSAPSDKYGNKTLQLQVWDAATGKPLYSYKPCRGGGEIRSLSADGRILAFSSSQRGPSPFSSSPRRGRRRPHTINKQYLFDLSSGKIILERDTGSEPYYVFDLSPDGRYLATSGRYTATERGSYDSYALLEDLATEKPVHLFTPGPVRIMGGRFIANGRELLTTHSSGESSVLSFWDVAGKRKPLPKPDDTSPEALGRLWTKLGDEDAARARKALWALAAIPKQAVPFLSKHLRPIPKLADKEIDRLIAALDARDYAERHKAKAQLELLSRRAEAALKKSLAAPDSLEQRKLIEAILRTLNPPYRSADRLRRLRAIEALERMGTPEARKLLQVIAKGASQTPETEDAKAALGRLDKQPAR